MRTCLHALVVYLRYVTLGYAHETLGYVGSSSLPYDFQLFVEYLD